MIRFKKSESAMKDLLAIMAALRSPEGCPWDKEQTHKTLRFHAVEEVYELMDAIEAEAVSYTHLTLPTNREV